MQASDTATVFLERELTLPDNIVLRSFPDLRKPSDAEMLDGFKGEVVCVWMVQLEPVTRGIEIPIELTFDRDILGIAYISDQPELFEHPAVSYAGVNGIGGSDRLQNDDRRVLAVLESAPSDDGDAFRVVTSC